MKYLQLIYRIVIVLCFFFFSTYFVHAITIEEINVQIDQTKVKKEKLEKEIKETAAVVEKLGQEKTTLQSTIKTLDTTKKKLDKDIKVTQVGISTTNLNIQKLALSIDEKKEKIGEGKQAMGKGLRALYELDSQSLIESLLAYASMSDMWNHAQALVSVNHQVQGNTRVLQGLARELESDKQETEAKKKELENQKKLLGSQKQTVETTQQQKTQVLKVTQNQETNFKKLLAEKKAQKDAFEKELFDFEQQLKIKVDPNSYPAGKIGVLFWPLTKHIITQLFGSTVDSKRLYTSGTHNGVDFGTPIGTPVKAALSGTVIGTGNTDIQPGCYSFGKWVMVSHSNGLSTIYGHLSSISVSQGDNVATGDLLGLSGNTGYSTGPHLHFGVYATQGTRIQRYASSNYCKNVTIPVADKSAYLDPMAYLPH